MALYDGFFDAVQDETTEEYDRAYSSGDFTGYFANVIGSGVCVHDNPDSFKAEYEGSTLYLRPGYLFIQGYWLANKAGEGEANYKGYAVTLPTGMTGSMAVVAHLNLGQRLIEIEVRAVSQAYPDALVLAIVTTSTAEDTRHNTDICGVIDTAGELSSKVEWALNYIDTEIESKLQQVEQDIAAQDAKLDAKIAEVQAVADSITPPPIGSIKFSASQNVGEEWLKCDGSFVNEADYPELVEALGKLTPGGDKFQLISSGEIGPQISNGVVYGGRMWVYSYSTKKLYGVDLAGSTAVKEIEVSSSDAHFKNFLSPTAQAPIALSIVPHNGGEGAKLFLAQVVKDTGQSSVPTGPTEISNDFLLFSAEFTGAESEISVAPPVNSVSLIENGQTKQWVRFLRDAIPYVISIIDSGNEAYCCNCCSAYSYSSGGNISAASYPSYMIRWTDENNVANLESLNLSVAPDSQQRLGFNQKSRNETVSVYMSSLSYGGVRYTVYSRLNNTFSVDDNTVTGTAAERRTSKLPINIAGESAIITDITKDSVVVFGRLQTRADLVKIGVALPSTARIFMDAGAYLWGKDIYMIFVGTGIVFSRTLEEGDFGYLDTTSVLGTITQFGYLDYSQDEGTLYLLGQDTTNTVKVAKIVLNTLYDYANDGAWLPVIASDGVPAYIKAKEAEQ